MIKDTFNFKDPRNIPSGTFSPVDHNRICKATVRSEFDLMTADGLSYWRALVTIYAAFFSSTYSPDDFLTILKDEKTFGSEGSMKAKLLLIFEQERDNMLDIADDAVATPKELAADMREFLETVNFGEIFAVITDTQNSFECATCGDIMWMSDWHREFQSACNQSSGTDVLYCGYLINTLRRSQSYRLARVLTLFVNHKHIDELLWGLTMTYGPDTKDVAILEQVDPLDIITKVYSIS